MRATAIYSKKSVLIEILIMVLIALSFFWATSFHPDGRGIVWPQLAFLANYLICAIVISYFILPLTYHKQKYVLFLVMAILSILGAVLIEECILEVIFYPDTRGSRFSGGLFNFIRMLPMVMLFTGFKFAFDAFNQQRHIKQLESVVNESQLRFLKSQVNPHFLFNSLNNLYSYALEQSPKTPEVILQLSSLMRYTLHEGDFDFVDLTNEVDFLRDFIDLNEMQIENRGKVSFIVDGDTKSTKVAPLIFIAFVENAFKHSASSQSSEIEIYVSLKTTDDQILFRCENSFSQLNSEISGHQGIGLVNVKERLNLIYPDRHTLDIDISADRYVVNLQISI